MKKNLIVYDFDKTIYGGESGTNYFQYYFRKYPLKGTLFSLWYLKEIFFYLYIGVLHFVSRHYFV